MDFLKGGTVENGRLLAGLLMREGESIRTYTHLHTYTYRDVYMLTIVSFESLKMSRFLF